MSTFPKPSKGRSSYAAVQKVMSTLLQFERKLDKLQDDVSFHGQTLHELKTLVFNLSAGSMTSPDGKASEGKRSQSCRGKKTTTAIQYDHGHSFEEPPKTRRKQAVQPLHSKIQSKMAAKRPPADSPKVYQAMNNKASSPRPRAAPVKNAYKTIRPSKAEAPRKATTLRTQKGQIAKYNKPAINV